MMSFQVAKGFGYRFTIVSRGKGAHNCYFCSEKRTGVENSYHCMGVPRTFGRHCRSMSRPCHSARAITYTLDCVKVFFS